MKHIREKKSTNDDVEWDILKNITANESAELSLTNDHDSEEISVINIPNNRFRPRLHTNHCCDDVHNRYCLAKIKKSLKVIYYAYQLITSQYQKLPLGWGRSPTAGTKSQCCISPSGTGWRKTGQPIRDNTALPRWHQLHPVRKQSTLLQRRTRMPSCPGRGQTVHPAECWSSSSGPVFHPHRLHETTQKCKHAHVHVPMW